MSIAHCLSVGFACVAVTPALAGFDDLLHDQTVDSAVEVVIEGAHAAETVHTVDSSTATSIDDFPLLAMALDGTSVSSAMGSAATDFFREKNLINGHGDSFGEATGGAVDSHISADATASLSAGFSVRRNVGYAIDWSIFTIGQSQIGYSEVMLTNADTGDVLHVFGTSPGATVLSGSESGTLSPGQYVISGLTESFALADQFSPSSGAISSAFDFTLTVVPAPGAAMLLSCGLVVLGRRRVRTGD